MGYTKRAFDKRYIKFRKGFKKPFNNTALLLPIGFTNDDYVNLFKELYLYLWEEIEREYSYWSKKNSKLLELKKPSRYNFPKPENFVIYNSYNLLKRIRKEHSEGKTIDKVKREELITKLKTNNKSKIAKRRDKEASQLKYVQELEPEHFQQLVNQFFNTSNLNNEAINLKFSILRELSKYKSPKTVEFFQKVNAVEKNISLRRFAFQTLQNQNEKVILRRNPKGKKKQMVYSKHSIVENPQAVLNDIYEKNKVEDVKEYDIFLCHSSVNEDEIINLYKLLNKNGLHVYVDWVCDQYALKREFLDNSTVDVIVERIKKSKSLLYINSLDSLNSSWVNWEIGLAHAYNKKICIYNLSNTPISYPILIYPEVMFSNGNYYIMDKSENSVKLYDWLKDDKNGQ